MRSRGNEVIRQALLVPNEWDLNFHVGGIAMSLCISSVGIIQLVCCWCVYKYVLQTVRCGRSDCHVDMGGGGVKYIHGPFSLGVRSGFSNCL